MTPDKFISLMHHDLRAPIRALKELPGWATQELSLHMAEPPAALATIFEMMTVQARRLDYMVEDLTKFSKIARTERQPRTLIAEVLPPVAAGFDVQVKEELWPMERDHLAAVLQHLCDNAMRHGRAGELGASFEATTHKGQAELQITDFGPGVDPRYFATMFEPMTTLQSRDIREGSGMGLATVARIAALYGGQCRAYTPASGKGLAVHFRCPMPDPSPAQASSGVGVA